VPASPLIAIVDDDAGMRVSLDGLLRSLSYRTALFASAEAFLESVPAARSDCVITDVHMPGGMSGLDLVTVLAKRDPTVPVILMSAFHQPQDADRIQESGARCILGKPFDDQTLIDCIEEALAA